MRSPGCAAAQPAAAHHRARPWRETARAAQNLRTERRETAVVKRLPPVLARSSQCCLHRSQWGVQAPPRGKRALPRAGVGGGGVQRKQANGGHQAAGTHRQARHLADAGVERPACRRSKLSAPRKPGCTARRPIRGIDAQGGQAAPATERKHRWRQKRQQQRQPLQRKRRQSRQRQSAQRRRRPRSRPARRLRSSRSRRPRR